MSAGKSWAWNLVALIGAPLVVTVLGSLILEWVKQAGSKGEAPADTAGAVKGGAASAPPAASARPPATAVLMGKWIRPDNGATLEFLPHGKMLMEYEGKAETFTYDVDPKDEVTVDNGKGITGEVISATRDELRVHWFTKKQWLWGGDAGTEETVIAFERFDAYQTRRGWIAIGVCAAVAFSVVGWVLYRRWKKGR